MCIRDRYIPTQWYDIILNARVKKNKFEVVHMKREDFKSMDMLKPVSYTHLDVYKRQTHRRSGHNVFWADRLL